MELLANVILWYFENLLKAGILLNYIIIHWNWSTLLNWFSSLGTVMAALVAGYAAWISARGLTASLAALEFTKTQADLSEQQLQIAQQQTRIAEETAKLALEELRRTNLPQIDVEVKHSTDLSEVFIHNYGIAPIKIGSYSLAKTDLDRRKIEEIAGDEDVKYIIHKLYKENIILPGNSLPFMALNRRHTGDTDFEENLILSFSAVHMTQVRYLFMLNIQIPMSTLHIRDYWTTEGRQLPR